MNCFVLFLLANFQIGATENSLYKDLAKFCGLNGFTFVTYFGKHLPKDIPVWNSALGIRTRIVMDAIELKKDPVDTLAVFYQSNSTMMFDLLQMIHKVKILRSIMIIEESFEAQLIESASALSQNLFFYVITTSKGVIKSKKKIMTIKGASNVISNDLEFNEYGGISSNFDLKGMLIVATSLSWAPFIEIKNCNRVGRGCQTKGLLVDIMNIWAKDFNFTWDIQADVNNSWGHLPVSGPYNLSGEWKGVMGDVVTGLYPMSLCPWEWFLERDPLLDFVHVTKNSLILVLLPMPYDFDPGLFIRPFTADAWLGAGIMLLLGAGFLYLPYLFFQFDDEQVSKRIITVSCWLLYILINAYYGGALTMFFVSENTLPFTSLRDVLQSFPDWTLIYQEGNDAYFQIPADQGDLDYKRFWDVASKSPEKYSVPSVEAGLEKLQGGKVIFYVIKGMLTGAFKENPKTFPPVKTFGETRVTFTNILFAKNSPLTPIFRQAVTKTFERGQFERLSLQWEGGKLPASAGADLMVLSAGQVFLIFGILVTAMFASLACFVLELVHFRLTK